MRRLLVGVIIVIAIIAVATVAVRYYINPSNSSSVFNSGQFITGSEFGRYLSNPGAVSPVGIASYGISNDSGTIRTYTINTTEVVGEANITALSALVHWNFTSSSVALCDECASLQMNLNLVVRTPKGDQTFWIQNVVEFVDTTQGKVTTAFGEISNATSHSANLDRNSTGNGEFGTSRNSTVYYFGSFSETSNYSLPLDVRLQTSVHTVEGGTGGVEIDLSDVPFGDRGELHLPIRDALSAFLVVSPTLFQYSHGDSYDAELAWGGPCCRQTSTFTAMGSSLSLSYVDSEGRTVPFPFLYSFGSDTSELASNLKVVNSHGADAVMIGQNNNTLLG